MSMEINFSMLPQHMRGGARRYIESGILGGGSFLEAVFENNLVEAFGRADDINIAAMRQWAQFLYGECPLPCWGSKEKVRLWCKACAASREEKAMNETTVTEAKS